jgi:hypothetical protein
MRFFRAFVALFLCVPPLLLPYRLRAFYLRFVAFLFHSPFLLFGWIARIILKQLKIESHDGR